jgi:hypothetical protein
MSNTISLACQDWKSGVSSCDSDGSPFRSLSKPLRQAPLSAHTAAPGPTADRQVIMRHDALLICILILLGIQRFGI